MKEYKFRAWHKKLKKIIDVACIDFASKIIYSLEHEEVFKSSFDDVILMQYTGLKDVNDKDIYENDIVKYCFDWTYIDEIRLPTYCEIKIIGIVKITMNGIKIKILKQECTEEGDTELSENLISSKYINFRKKTKDVKIIGNIYENPELLEVTND